MNLVSNGDSVLIDAGIYLADVGVWSASNLFISGVGGLAHMKASGASAQGKAIWVISGHNTIVEHIEFSEASVQDENGAGIRQEGDNLTLRHCYFHDNENGILAGDNANSTIIIEYCTFHDNGFGTGFTHNIYVNHIADFQLRHSYVHHAKEGHNVKSRAQNTSIEYNRIMDEVSGYASYQIDLSNGGNAVIVGNLIQQGPNAANSSMIAYGLEGLTNSNNQLHFYNNSLLNQRTTVNTYAYRWVRRYQKSSIIYLQEQGSSSSDQLIRPTTSFSSIRTMPVTQICPPSILTSPPTHPPLIWVQILRYWAKALPLGSTCTLLKRKLEI